MFCDFVISVKLTNYRSFQRLSLKREREREDDHNKEGQFDRSERDWERYMI